ncbi:uncharacterized protein At4g06744 [Lotus japonicus]|uniref:uncharacterized protein At4g06744 n=1 Tax=Lotus japonicus TaxID=34305 RepID=UPI002585E679|nr:uncharacterized protein At4g06744 [Lotus japonicus]
MIETKSLSFFSLLVFALFFLHFHLQVNSQHIAASEREALGLEQSEPETERKALEIIIGSGGGGSGGPSPAPSPASCPPPPPKPLSRLDKARRVLLKFAANIDDPNCYTKTWNSQTDTCQFNGIRCGIYPNSNERAVAGIDLNTAGVSGKNGNALSLYGILDSIPELTFFHVNSNNFSGAVPSEILKFTYFYELDISNNKFSGEFPMDVLKFSSKQLIFLDIRFNRYHGAVPPQLFNLNLDVIFINNNQFSGYLPENFGSTPARYLTFANNLLTGPIPKSIGNASKTLTEVLFLGNQFDGCLPYEIGYLKRATVFDVSNNHLTGPIPQSFACLEKIRFLNLAQNKFYGKVPESVCVLPGIRNNGNFSLSDNYFTEVGPECWKLIKSKVLDVSKNCIPGLSNQKSPKECYDFKCKVKPCQNQQSLSYVPCKGYWQKEGESSVSKASSAPSEPVTYKSLKPHRLRL